MHAVAFLYNVIHNLQLYCVCLLDWYVSQGIIIMRSLLMSPSAISSKGRKGPIFTQWRSIMYMHVVCIIMLTENAFLIYSGTSDPPR